LVGRSGTRVRIKTCMSRRARCDTRECGGQQLLEADAAGGRGLVHSLVVSTCAFARPTSRTTAAMVKCRSDPEPARDIILVPKSSLADCKQNDAQAMKTKFAVNSPAPPCLSSPRGPTKGREVTAAGVRMNSRLSPCLDEPTPGPVPCALTSDPVVVAASAFGTLSSDFVFFPPHTRGPFLTTENGPS